MINLRNRSDEELIQMLQTEAVENRNDILEELRERGYNREEIRQMEGEDAE